MTQCVFGYDAEFEIDFSSQFVRLLSFFFKNVVYNVVSEEHLHLLGKVTCERVFDDIVIFNE